MVLWVFCGNQLIQLEVQKILRCCVLNIYFNTPISRLQMWNIPNYFSLWYYDS